MQETTTVHKLRAHLLLLECDCSSGLLPCADRSQSHASFTHSTPLVLACDHLCLPVAVALARTAQLSSAAATQLN
jgi:hypothetical protein